MKLLIIAVLLLSYMRISYAQEDTRHTASFLKRIENNLVKSGLEETLSDGSVKPIYNLEGKTDQEKMFFGDCNAWVEFFIDSDSGGFSGFRVIKDSSENSYRLDVKTISNFNEVNEALSETYPFVSFSAEQLPSLSDSMIGRSSLHNCEMASRREEESRKRYRVETRSFRIGDRLARALHDKTVALIERFDRKTGEATDCRVTFRCVVGPEVRMLSIKDEPRNEARELTDLFQRIVGDAGTGRLHETEYLEQLAQ